MKKSRFALFAGAVFAALCSVTSNAATIQYLGPTLPTDISQNGSVVVGNLPNSYETFRWTASTGVVPLGRPTAPTLNIGAGSPDVSWDGTKVSAAILSDAGTEMVAGQWTLGSGWNVLGPLPANAVSSDASVATAWGMSGDGNTVVGSYSVAASKVHAHRWTSATGMVDLGAVTNRNSRASEANYNGSVIVGWDAAPTGFPGRTPTLWTNGVKTSLGVGLVDCELSSVSADGTIVAGNWRDASDPVRGAAIWRFDGSNWNLQKLGVLPGTSPDQVGAIVDDLSADGSIAVGYNRYDINSQFNATGFYWSEATGMISAEQLLSNLGLSLPSNYDIQELTSISPDGSTIGGIAIDGVGYQGFLISIPEPGSLCLLGLMLPLMGRRRNS